MSDTQQIKKFLLPAINGFPVIAGNLFGGMMFTGFMLYWSYGKVNY